MNISLNLISKLLFLGFLVISQILLGSFSQASDNFNQITPLTCNLSNLNSLPLIQLVGESHYRENSVNFKKNLLSDSAAGKYLVASETSIIAGINSPFYPSHRNKVALALEGDALTSKLYGIQNPISYQVFSSFKLQFFYFANKMSAYDIFKYFLLLSKDGNLFFKSLESITSSTDAPVTLKNTAQKIINIIKSKSKSHYDIINIDLSESFNFSKNFLDIHHAHLISIINNNYLNYFNEKPLKPSLTNDDFIDYINGLTYNKGQSFNLAVKVKDRDFARNIGQLICNNKESKIVVLVGAAHMAGVERHLNTLSKKKLIIEKYLSHKDPIDILDCSIRNICP